MSENVKLDLTLQAIAQIFDLASEDPFILDIIRAMPEKDIRFVMDGVPDNETAAYLACFENLQEYEWCRVIHLVIEERKIKMP